MKKEYIFIIIFLAVTGGLFFFGSRYNNSSKNIIATTTPDVLEATLKIAPIISEYSSTTYTSIALNYPKSSETELRDIYLTVRDIKDDFVKAYGGLTKDDADKMYISSSDPYETVINTKIEKSDKTVTYILYAYQYTGGAHGGTGVYTFTYDINGKLLRDADVFESNYLNVVAPLAKDYFYLNLDEYKNPSMIDDGTSPVYDNYRAWYLTNDSLVFIFGQYQVGPYVLGIQEFRIDKEKIKNILKSEYK